MLNPTEWVPTGFNDDVTMIVVNMLSSDAGMLMKVLVLLLDVSQH